MIVKLLPDQISKFWDIIRYAVEQSLPPTAGQHPNTMNFILMAALEGRIDVWVSFTRKEVTKIEAIMLTRFIYDHPTRTRNLLIYSLFGYKIVSKESWMKGLETIAKYAKKEKCTQIVAYTNLDSVSGLAKELGGDTDYTFISFNVRRLLESLDSKKE